ncbi:MAG: metallophosphoesterase [Alphaproteobacteria bacterium]|nr:metallophosphoesterase [Alphaproteobacteria bacterium]
MHPELILPLVLAVVGLPALGALAWLLFRRWRRLAPLLRWTVLVVLALAEIGYWLGVYAVFIEPNRLIVRRETIVSDAWRGPPLTIAAIGDVHIGSPHMSVARVRRLVARTNALSPDLTLLLGDYVGDNGPGTPLRNEAAVLEGLEALGGLRARLGVFAVIGNHDAWWDAAQVRAALKTAGVTVLVNASRLARAEDPVVIVGLDDHDTGKPNYAAAASQLGEAALLAPRIAFMHSPDAFPDIPAGPALTLAAHTHCGQVSLPFLGRPVVPSVYGQKYACGLVVEEGRQLFVTGGVATSVLPVRFLNPPEIAFLTIVAPAAD